jgi:hypothetical protein
VEGARRCGARPRPKTLSRYLKLAGRLAGITGPIPLDELRDIAEALVWSGKLKPASKWIDHYVIQEANERGRAQFQAGLAMSAI